MNLPFMNTVNVVFSRFICYLISFSVIVISALNLLGLGTLCVLARLRDRQWNHQHTQHFQANSKMFTVLLHEIFFFTGVVVFDKLSIHHHKQQNSQRQDNILIQQLHVGDWPNLNTRLSLTQNLGSPSQLVLLAVLFIPSPPLHLRVMKNYNAVEKGGKKISIWISKVFPFSFW